MPCFHNKTSAVTNRLEHAKLLFSFETYNYCQSLSEDGFDLHHGVKSYIRNPFEISSSVD